MVETATDLGGQEAYRLEGVVKSYAGRQVLEVDELTIRRGEIFTLVGPSGAGKSTLLRLLCFLEQADAGILRFAGRPLPDGQVPLALRRQVTMVFQRPMLLDRSVRENVRFGLRLRGEEGAERVEAALRQVGLAALAGQRARQLSGGEAQRVALARALVLRPEVLLLDEPTANLDPYNVRLMEEIVRERSQVDGMTVVLVTHNVFQARRMGQRAALLLEGRVIEAGEAAAFFHQPQDPRTRLFVNGEMVY